MRPPPPRRSSRWAPRSRRAPRAAPSAHRQPARARRTRSRRPRSHPSHAKQPVAPERAAHARSGSLPRGREPCDHVGIGHRRREARIARRTGEREDIGPATVVEIVVVLVPERVLVVVEVVIGGAGRAVPPTGISAPSGGAVASPRPARCEPAERARAGRPSRHHVERRARPEQHVEARRHVSVAPAWRFRTTTRRLRRALSRRARPNPASAPALARDERGQAHDFRLGEHALPLEREHCLRPLRHADVRPGRAPFP